MKRARGFTLLEMVVATTIMAIAIVGLMSGIASTTHNASRLRDYDRAVQLARVRMSELLLDARLPRNSEINGAFDPQQTGGLNVGWRARLTNFEMPPRVIPGQAALDRVVLEVSWMSGSKQRSFALEAYRQRILTNDDAAAAAAGAVK